MWQRNRPKRNHGVRPLEHLCGESQSTAEHEGDVASARKAQRVQPLGQLLRGQWLALLPIQSDHIRLRGYPPEKLRRLGGEHLLRQASVHVLLRNLNDFHGEEASQSFEIVVRAVGGPSFQGADRDDRGTPNHRAETIAGLPTSRRRAVGPYLPSRRHTGRHTLGLLWA